MLEKRKALEALRIVIDRIYNARAYVPNDAAMTLQQFELELDEIERATADDIDNYMAGLYANHNKRRPPPLAVTGTGR